MNSQIRLFDSHSHIDDKSFNDDFKEMIYRSIDAGVVAIMVAGVTPETVSTALQLARLPHGQQHIFIAVGMHPHDAQYCSDDIIDNYKQIASKNPSVVKAWGETGLDFNRMHSPRDLQEKWLIRQIEAADDLLLPMIFHERDSNGRFLQILDSMNHQQRKGVIHCFSGNKQEMFKYLDLGYYIGITGILTIQQRGELLRELAVLIPEDRIVIETDAPYLTPTPMKNKTRRNEPAFVRYVLERLAQIKGVNIEYLAEVLWNNTCTLYNISL